ncbi:1-phosphofructokinase [bacterium]|nr:MAG: 1-phosphofructokinase [bacterium]
MIYTITLNPALDRTIYVEHLLERESIKVLREERYAGGKGIDVSRVIAQLGGESIAIAFLGGYAGKEMEGRLLNEGVAGHFIWTKGETRINVIAHCIQTGREIRFNFPGPTIQPQELSELVNICRNLSPKPTFAVISGSVPQGVNPVIYENLILTFESQGARVILDTYGEPLKKGLLATPFMIKPNRKELSELVGTEIETIDDAISSGKEILKYTQVIAVSLGREGLLGITHGGIYLATPPEVEAVNTVGAGDSTVAAMVIALEKQLPLDEVFRYGAAAGTASTLTEGTATVNVRDFKKILAQTKIKRID